MPTVFCLIPQDRTFKPRAADVAAVLTFLLDQEYIDNDDVYLDIAYEDGHHRPGASDMITVETVAGELAQADDIELTDFFVENIRGTARIPQLFENSDQKNLSLVGWLAVRIFEQPYPIFASDERYLIRCAACGRQAAQDEWSQQGTLRRCPACDELEELHQLQFSPAVEFARFILEISELVFTDGQPRLKPEIELVEKLQDILGTPLKAISYQM